MLASIFHYFLGSENEVDSPDALLRVLCDTPSPISPKSTSSITAKALPRCVRSHRVRCRKNDTVVLSTVKARLSKGRRYEMECTHDYRSSGRYEDRSISMLGPAEFDSKEVPSKVYLWQTKCRLNVLKMRGHHAHQTEWTNERDRSRSRQAAPLGSS